MIVGASEGRCMVPVVTNKVVERAAGCVARASIVPSTVSSVATAAAHTRTSVMWLVDTAGASQARVSQSAAKPLTTPMKCPMRML